MDNINKFKELTNDIEFMKKVLGSETKEEVKILFNSQGVNLSDEDLKIIADILNEIAKTTSNLSEDELENISGGSLVGFMIKKSPPVVGYKLIRGAIEGSAVTSVEMVKSIGKGAKRTFSWWRKI